MASRSTLEDVCSVFLCFSEKEKTVLKTWNDKFKLLLFHVHHNIITSVSAHHSMVWKIWWSKLRRWLVRHLKKWDERQPLQLFMKMLTVYLVCIFWVRGRPDQDWRSHEEVIKGVVQQADTGGGVKICITHELAGKQGLPGATAQEASHLSVWHIHPVGQHLPTQTTASAKQHWHRSVTRKRTTEDVPLLYVTFIRVRMALMSGHSWLLLSMCLQITNTDNKSKSSRSCGKLTLT